MASDIKNPLRHCDKSKIATNLKEPANSNRCILRAGANNDRKRRHYMSNLTRMVRDFSLSRYACVSSPGVPRGTILNE